MAQTDSFETSHDPLWRSLERILSFYQLRMEKALAASQVAIDWSKPLTPSDIMLIGRHLGLEVALHALAGVDIASLTKPALIMLPEKKSLVALPKAGEVPALWVPEGDIDVDALCASRRKDLYVIEFERKAGVVTQEESDEKKADWFWGLLRREGRAYFDIGLATFFINLFILITPLFSMTVFDRVVPNHAYETLTALTIGILLAFVFNLGFKLIRGHVLGEVVARVSSKLDTEFMDQLLRLNIPAHKLTVGERFDLFNQLQGLRDFFASRLVPAIVDLPFFLLFLVVVFIISPAVSIVVIIGVVLMLINGTICRIKVNSTSKQNFRESRGRNAALVEMLTGAPTIRMFNAVGSQLYRWQRLVERSSETARNSQHAAGVADDLSLTIMSLVSIFVIVVGVHEIDTGNLSMGGLVACNILVSRTLSPIMTLAAVLGRLRQSLDSLKMVDNIFHMPSEPKLSAAYEPKGPFRGGMQLRDVTFYHPAQIYPTLYHFNLEIKPGDRIGIIGRTGAGKSTVTRLLDGSLTPQSGQIFADGLVLDAIHPAEWRQSLGIVPQEPYVFSGTLRENILLGTQNEVDEGWLKQVLAMSGLDLLMQQAGYGLDFNIGEAGSRLSGGQRQSLAIARALVRKPNILLLDEPTNGMDSDLEMRVATALRNYAQDKTMVLVTHRTTLLGLVNRLVLIDRGAVAADGAPDDVIRRLSGKGAPANGQ